MKFITKISDIPELTQDKVFIRNEEELVKKINKIIKDGHENLQIITDFDHTLTKHNLENGMSVLTSFGMFRECPSIPQEYKDEDNRLADIYKPIERDPHMALEEKTKHMVEWYQAANAQLRGVPFPRQELADIGHKMIASFRHGVRDMISWSQAHQVPVLVFSAGLGDAVVAALKAADFLLPHVKVVSNFLAMGSDDKIAGIKGEIIHTLNKNETGLQHTEYYALVRARRNALVLGDSAGDAGMAAGLRCAAELRLALLPRACAPGPCPPIPPAFLQLFDVVLGGDPPFDVVNAILKRL